MDNVNGAYDIKKSFYSAEKFQGNLEIFKSNIRFNKINRDFSYTFTDLIILYHDEICENYLKWLLEKWRFSRSKIKKLVKFHSVWAHKQIVSSNFRINKIFKVLHSRRENQILKNTIKRKTVSKNVATFENCMKIKLKSAIKVNINQEPQIKIHISIFNSKLSSSSANLECEIHCLKNSTLYSLGRQISCFLKVNKMKRSCFLINETCYTSLRDYLFFKNIIELSEKKIGLKYYFVKSLNVRLSTLAITFGKVHFYVHGGLCQHKIVFNNVSSINI